MGIHKLRGLEYLVAVVDSGGFSAAARRLGVATPSVHRLVQALEAERGVALIDRSAQPLRPTPYAVAYVERARVLLAELRELDASLDDQSQAPRGTISLAADSVVREYLLPAMLPAFHARCPDVEVHVTEAGSVRDLARLGTDMLMQSGWPPAQDAILRTLAETRWLVVATPSYWARHGQPRQPCELAHHRCALYRTPFGEVLRKWVFERDGRKEAVDVEGWLVSDSRSVLDGPLRAGQIVARVNDLSIRAGLADGSLQPVLLDWTGLHAPPISLVVKRSLTRQPRVRAWIDFAAEHAKQLAQDRLPGGLPPVRPSERPDWWRRRVSPGARGSVR
ncbi:MAG: LysR family transcriptional regulator [Burkholderiaceae bacterium]|nr:LysR family transcriptional regulator [Burkholderiaceae bacterium]